MSSDNNEYFDIYVVKLYSNISSTSMVLSISLFPLLALLVMQNSKQLGIYKFYILAHSTSSIGFEIFLWILKPVGLFPASVIWISGVAKNLNSYTNWMCMTILLIFWVNVSVTLSLSITYRCFAVKLFYVKVNSSCISVVPWQTEQDLPLERNSNLLSLWNSNIKYPNRRPFLFTVQFRRENERTFKY